MKHNLSHRILVIDDNTSIHEDFRKILMTPATHYDHLKDMESALFGSPAPTIPSAVYEVDCASQGKEGLEMVREAISAGLPYAVAFVDVRMPPGWDGIETISHLWRECPDLQVVLCTAYSDYSWQEIQQELGSNDSLLILKKPFDNVEVYQLVHALTRKWELNREIQNRLDSLDDMVRRRTKEKEHTRAILEAALEHSPSGIIISDAKESKILWANFAALDVYESPHLFSTGTSLHNVDWQAFRTDGSTYLPEDFPLLRAVLKSETIKNEEILIRNIQGRERWISSNAAPILDPDGTIVAGILVFQDITDRKQSEKKQEKLQAQLNHAQKMESVGLLAGGVAHDFNNALAAILAYTELGMRGISSTDPIYKKLTGIQKAAQRSADLTKQLLAFARRQTVSPKVLDLNKLLGGMLKMMHRLIGENIELLWKPEAELWPVKIDISQMDQILVNLCVNARDAISGVGKLIIETRNMVFDESYCALHPECVCGQYAMISVSDNGHGIKKENISHIFDPFFTTKQVGMGTGLGLSTVYGIVKQNNGFIYVYSELEKGTTFKIYLPRVEDKLIGSTTKGTSQLKRGQGEMVLLVEDQEDILEMTKEMLICLGYEVVTARSPGEALRKAKDHNHEIKLLLTDVVMPEMNGQDLVKRMVSLNPDLKYLYMSGYTANVIAHHGVLDEGIPFIQKPFSVKNLAVKIKEVLYHK